MNIFVMGVLFFPPLIPVCASQRNVIRKEENSVSKEFQEHYTYNKSQRDTLLLKFIFGIELYMFRTDLLSIIRSLNP